MSAFDCFHYWTFGRRATVEALTRFSDAELDRPAFEGLPTAGDLARHIITTDELWLEGGIAGRPLGDFRPQHWERWDDRQKREWRRKRFPDVASVTAGLEATFRRLRDLLAGREYNALAEQMVQPAWPGAKAQALGHVVWHLVSHEAVHRGQIFTRLRTVGKEGALPPMNVPPPPRPLPNGATAADAVPLWKEGRLSLLQALRRIPPERFDEVPEPLSRALGEDSLLLSAGDLARHILAAEQVWALRYLLGEDPDFVIPEAAGGPSTQPEPSRVAWLRERLPGPDDVTSVLRQSGDRILAGLERLPAAALLQPRATHRGEVLGWRIAWHVWEHAEHHRGQIHLRMRLMGLTPPGG